MTHTTLTEVEMQCQFHTLLPTVGRYRCPSDATCTVRQWALAGVREHAYCENHSFVGYVHWRLLARYRTAVLFDERGAIREAHSGDDGQDPRDLAGHARVA